MTTVAYHVAHVSLAQELLMRVAEDCYLPFVFAKKLDNIFKVFRL